MRLAINTSCAVAGGAITHLRNLLPSLVERLDGDELLMIGDADDRDRIDPGRIAKWHEVESIERGLVGRLRFENLSLPRVLREIEADVLFHPGNFAVFRAAIPQVILIHNLAPFLPAVVEGESLAQKVRLGILGALTRVSMRRVSATIFISAWGRQLVTGVEETAEEHMPIVPFGSEHLRGAVADGVLERWGLSPGGFVLSVSHLYRYKKIEKLLSAYATLGSEVDDLPLVIVGEGYDREYTDRMKQLARAGSAPVVFTGGLAAEEIAALMSACRVFVFTSEAENLPITLLEAMERGCAILTNRECSMPEICMDAAAYADPPTSDEYCVKLATLLRDPALREALSVKARRRAADFSWASAAAETLAVLRRVAVSG